MLEYVRGQGWVEVCDDDAVIVTFRCGTRARCVYRKPQRGESWNDVIVKAGDEHHYTSWYFKEYVFDEGVDTESGLYCTVFEPI